MNSTEMLGIMRSLTGDEATAASAQRRNNEWYVARLDEGMRLLYDNCPESQLDDTGLGLVAFAKVDQSSPDAELWPSDLYLMDLAHYVAYRFFVNDAGDTQDSSRAEAHKKMCLGTVLIR